MTIKISDALANNLLKGVTIDQALAGGFIYIFAGAEPATADTVLDMAATHCQLAMIAADVTPADTGVIGLRFAAASASRALAKLGSQTWACKVNNSGFNSGTNPQTAAFFRFVSAPVQTPIQQAASTSAAGGTLAAATYYYVISALNAAGESLRSNEVSIVTTGATSSNTINWTEVDGATSYRVYRGTAADTQATYYTVSVTISNTNITGALSYLDTNAATTGGSPSTGDTGRVVGTAYTPRIQCNVGTSGTDIVMTSVSLTDNGVYTVGLSTFEIRVAA